MMNITKSIAFEVDYANLPNVENFLTNFNRLVLQNGIVNKIQVCFDLPVSKFLNLHCSPQLLSPAHYILRGVSSLDHQ